MPRRRCAGCGRIAPKTDLLRMAVLRRPGAPALAVCDPRGTMPGRGAYLCRAGEAPAAAAARVPGAAEARLPGTAEPRLPAVPGSADVPAAQCLAAALRRGAIARTLRTPVAVDPKLVESVGP